MRTWRILVLTLATGVLLDPRDSGGALAQENPLAPRNPAGEPPPQERPFVPEFIRPGARFVFESGSASPGAAGAPSAGAGFTRMQVVAVGGSKVLLSQTSYSSIGGGIVFAGGQGLVVGATEVRTGGALWIDPGVLAGFRSDAETEVSTGPVRFHGRGYEATSLTRVSRDDATRLFFDRATGLLLARQVASGSRREGATDPFQREISSTMSFIEYRQTGLPWANAKWPEWAGSVRKIHFRGRQTLAGAIGPAVGMDIAQTLTILDRGDAWAICEAETRFGNQPPARERSVHGTGVPGGFCIPPEALQAMKPGRIDRDEVLKQSLQYEVAETPNGRVGVITETGDNSAYRLAWAYRLHDGALVHSTLELPALDMKIEMEREGTE